MRKRRIFSLITTIILTTNLFVGITPASAKTENIRSQMEQKLKDSINYYENNNNYSENTNEEKIDNQEEIRIIVELSKMDENVLKDAESITGNKVEKIFDTLVCGFSISGKASDIEKIKKLKNVVSVEKAMEIDEKMYSSVQTTQAQNVWHDYGYTGKGMVIAVLDSGMDLGMEEFETIDSSNLKITKEQAESKIKQLGKGKYYNDKVPFVYDYVDKDNDVSTDVTNHGNHVAGIAAANGQEYNGEADVNENSIRGMAPNSQVLVMKVFSTRDGNNFFDCCIEALEDAVELNADVVNMSFGRLSDTQNENSLWRKALDKAAEKGVVIVNSAGNDSVSTSNFMSNELDNPFGIKDTATLDYISDNIITVASAENEYDVPSNYLRFVSTKGTDISTKFINYTEEGTSSDFTSNLDFLKEENEFCYCYEGKDEQLNDIDNKVVFINSSDIDNRTNTLTNIYDTVSRKEGKALVLIQSSNSMMTYFLDSIIEMPLITIGPNKGKMFISSIESGDNKFKLEGSNGLVERKNGGDINNFSSWGPTPNFELKPEISAPGGDIYSTLGNGEHGAMSGTSMSSPSVAGAVMLLKEGIAEKNINLSGIDLTKYIKIALMNTAEPSINDDNIPFSPRQQGAGMMKVEKAIKNNVTAVNEDGNAYVRLLNIGNEASFKIRLKNYGNESVTYSLKDEDLYTETVENDLVKEIKIEGAKISFSTSSVTVNGNSEVEVIGKVKIPNTLEKNNYVEGYISLKNNNGVSLNVPVLGFYGDWDSEKIMDDPCYKESSLYKATGLGLSTGVYASYFYYYGTDGDESGVLPAGSVNKDKVAISPNGDGKYDNVDARVFRLRNSKEMTYEVLDSNKKVIKTLESISDVNKNVIGSFENYFYDSGWNGKIYNTKTGKDEVVEDGQYYIRVKAKGYLENSKEQIIDMPLKVDTTGPKISDISIQQLGGTSYRIQWRAEDELSEVSNNNMIITLNDSDMIDINDIKSNDGFYYETVDLAGEDFESVTIGVVDTVGNTTISRVLVDSSVTDAIQFENLYDGIKINDKNYNIKAVVGQDISRVNINNKDIEINNGSIENNLSLEEGNNIVYVKAWDNNNNCIYNKAYNVLLDTTAPSYEILCKKDELGKFMFTNEDENATFKLKVNDMSKVTCIATNISNGVYNERQVVASSDENNIITINISGWDGTNVIELEVYDELGNKCENQQIKVYQRNENLENLFVITLDINEDPFLSRNYIYINSNDLNEDGTYDISGVFTSRPVSFKIDGEEVKVNNDFTFSKSVKIKEGTNIFTITGSGYTWGELQSNEQKVTIYYDNKAPEVTYDNLNEDSDGCIYTPDEVFVLSGIAKDSNDYSLSINNSKIFTTSFDTTNEEGFEKEFKRAINLQDGENKILVEAEDINGNKYSKVLKVILDKERFKRKVLARYIDIDTREEISKS
ncbi:MAG: S8 family serine peptidase, partial [Clostridium sp.]|nr:S8 family serine peptidase [Clostridium sp.]